VRSYHFLDGFFPTRVKQVPLDYANTSGPQAAIAILKMPSKIPRGQKGYRGPILFNPGGPGNSGVRMLSVDHHSLLI
jgi:hypothetical protein